jgi:hypothetical protein
LERKNTWLDQAIKEKKWKVKAEEIRNWMKELENKHNNIIKQINDFKSRLNCKNQQELELYDELKK